MKIIRGIFAYRPWKGIAVWLVPTILAHLVLGPSDIASAIMSLSLLAAFLWFAIG